MEEVHERAVIAIDLGGTSIRAAVVAGGRLHGRVRHDTPAREGPEAVADAIASAARESIAAAGTLGAAVAALGIAAPGPLNGAAGIVYSPPNLDGWRDVPLASMLRARLGLPVSLAKDTNAAALAEHRLGAGRGTSVMIYVTISTGIGGGLILNGAPYEGPDGTAGEVGHVTVDRDGPLCNCGNWGCLEAVASGTALARQAADRIAAGRMPPPEGNGTPSAAEVIAAARRGEPEAAELVRAAGHALGLACAGLIHLFNPEAIVFGGGLLHAGHLLMGPLEAAVAAHTMPVPRARARLVRATFGDDVGLWGAALQTRIGVGTSPR